jgi:hypothetical protein
VATVTVRGAVDDNRPSRAPGDPAGRTAPLRPPVASRQEVLDLLRRLAVNVETANVLDARAERCPSPHLAAVLRERAQFRRRTAERFRADLARQGVTVVRRRPPDPGGR